MVAGSRRMRRHTSKPVMSGDSNVQDDQVGLLPGQPGRRGPWPPPAPRSRPRERSRPRRGGSPRRRPRRGRSPVVDSPCSSSCRRGPRCGPTGRAQRRPVARCVWEILRDSGVRGVVNGRGRTADGKRAPTRDEGQSDGVCRLPFRLRCLTWQAHKRSSRLQIRQPEGAAFVGRGGVTRPAGSCPSSRPRRRRRCS